VSVSKAVTKSVEPPRELLSKARAMLEQARTLDEILHVRAIAGSYERFFKAAKESRTTAKQAAEIRLRAERKAGQVLIDMEKSGERAGRGGRRWKK